MVSIDCEVSECATKSVDRHHNPFQDKYNRGYQRNYDWCKELPILTH